MDCPICCEKNKSPVSCQCGFEACRPCVRTYLAGQISEPHCMSCKLAWGLEFLEEAIGKTYLKTEFKKQRAAVFVEFEKTQLPDMQEDARKYEITQKLKEEISVYKNENAYYNYGSFGCNWCKGASFKLYNICEPCSVNVPYDKSTYSHRLDNLRLLNLRKHPERILKIIDSMNNPHYTDYTYKDFRLKCTHCKVPIKKEFYSNLIHSGGTHIPPCLTCDGCKKSMCTQCFDTYEKGHTCEPIGCICHQYHCDTCKSRENEEKIHALKQQIAVINEVTPKERKSFIMKCQYDGCEGFLSQAYKCGLCTKFTCSQCYIPKEEGHECNPDNVASAKMIREETRPCPKCSTRIYKIDGCDQMWCTDCKTAFSWRTGNIVNGTIHNPHFYEYMRNTTGTVPRTDNPCGELVDNHTLNQFIIDIERKIKKQPIYRWLRQHIVAFHRYLGEVNDEMQVISTEINDMRGDRFTQSLKENRILYLLKRIDKERFEHDAFMYHQRSVQHRKFLELIQMKKQVLMDIFNNMYGYFSENMKTLTSQQAVEQIIDTYRQIFALVEYFYKQNTPNPYTKIYSDHYGTMFNLMSSPERKKISEHRLPPPLSEFNTGVYLHMSFVIIKEFKDKKE